MDTPYYEPHFEKKIPAKIRKALRASGYGSHWHLSDLIEACGERFQNLYIDKSDNSWRANTIDSEYTALGMGKTPEEAVARLLLALTKDKE